MTPTVDTPPNLLIGGYHKTGTIWLRRLSHALAGELGRPFVNISQHVFRPDAPGLDRRTAQAKQVLEQGVPKIIFDCNCRFLHIENSIEHLGFRLVRDPRDVIISSANYHGWSDELSLHEPQPEWGGATYQQAMMDLDLANAIHFEIDNKAGSVVREMIAFDRGIRFRTFTYEGIVVARDPSITQAIAQHMQVPSRVLTLSLEKSWQTNAARVRARTAGIRSHIQDGSAAQWVYLFDASHLAHMNDVIPNCAEILGYRASSVDALQPDAVKKLRYSSRFWANRKNYMRAIEDAIELSRLTDDADTTKWLARLYRMREEDDG